MTGKQAVIVRALDFAERHVARPAIYALLLAAAIVDAVMAVAVPVLVPGPLGLGVAVGSVVLVFACGVRIGRMWGDGLLARLRTHIRRLEQMAAHQTRSAADETVAMPPVTLNSDGELTQVLPWINGEARRG